MQELLVYLAVTTVKMKFNSLRLFKNILIYINKIPNIIREEKEDNLSTRKYSWVYYQRIRELYISSEKFKIVNSVVNGYTLWQEINFQALNFWYYPFL